MKFLSSKLFFWLLPFLVLSLWGCSYLRESNTAWPVKDYEKLIAGRLDADYVGNDSCVEKCHTHKKLTEDFRLSVHGAQVSRQTGLPLVNCESCHGPGSLAVANIQNDTCDFSTFIPIEEIPAGAQSLVCLKCHSSYSLSNLAGWNNSRHATAEVSCSDCHTLHQGTNQKVARNEIAELCLSCHEEKRALFSLPSHHPVLEGQMTCIDCHDAHDTAPINRGRMMSKDLCTPCHMDKKGPFVVEHGTNLTDDCVRCHNPHGSINSNLNKWAQPFICIQCHNGHNTRRHPGLTRAGLGARTAMFGKCTFCHVRHHGSDSPGFRIDGRLFR